MIRGDSFQNLKTSLLVCIALSAAAGVEASPRGEVVKVCRSEAKGKKSAGVRDNMCGAAKDYLNAANAHSAGGKVMSAVAVVCTTACVNKMNSMVCTGANLGGAAASGAIEKNFINSLTPIASGLPTSLKPKTHGEAIERIEPRAVTLQGHATATTAADSAPSAEAVASAHGHGLNKDACKTAATAAKGSFDKHQNSTSEEKKITEIKGTTDKMNETQKQGVVTIGADGRAMDARAITAGVIPGEDEACSESKLRTALGALNCAVKRDPNLPPGVATHEFIKDLEKATGKPADDFFANYRDPGTALLNGTAHSLSGSQQQGLVNSIQEMHKVSIAEHRSSESDSGFARSGGGRRSAGAQEPEFDMAGALNQMMGQLAGTDGAKEAAPTVATTAFEKASRGLAEIGPEDRSFSIFDRVKLRYSVVQQKQHLGAPQ